MRSAWVLFGCFALACGGSAGTTAAASKTTPAPGAAAPKPGALKPWKDVLKDTEPRKGFITAHIKKDQTIYFELAPDRLGQDFGMVLHVSQGMGAAWLIDGIALSGSALVRFERVGNNVFLVHRNNWLTAEPGTPMHRSVRDNVGNSIIGVLPVVSEQAKTNHILIDATKFFASNYPGLEAQIQPTFGPRPLNPVVHDPTRSYVADVMSFPRNTEVDARLTYTAGQPPIGAWPVGASDYRWLPVGVRYSLFALPEQPMRPRLADDRVGYFTTPFYDFSRDRADTGLVEYITRWRLDKRDPSAAVSDPVQPIVFYLDTSIPDEYRADVREGVEVWNRALAAAGISNAVVAKDAPDDPSWHAEDIRYSTIRWSAAYTMGFAIGPSQVDPRTGEILNADILVWSEFVRGWQTTFDVWAAPMAAAGRFAGCGASIGVAYEIGFHQLVAQTFGQVQAGGALPREFLREAIIALVSHEVGHTLGLRHNYKSSTSVPFDKLHDVEFTDNHGLTGSVMDYTPVNLNPDPAKQGAYYSVNVGPYDVWAIQYGYSTVGGDSTTAEKPGLAAIARRSTEPQLAYSTDEDTLGGGFGADPTSNRWDLGDDPVAFVDRRIQVIDRVLPRIESSLVADGEAYAKARQAYYWLTLWRYGGLTTAAKQIGGVMIHRDHKGDPNQRPAMVPVSAARQRAAVALILARGFADGTVATKPELLNMLAPQRTTGFSWWTSDQKPKAIDVPLHQIVKDEQARLLGVVLAPARLSRVLDNEVRMPGGAAPYRLEALFTALTDGLFAELLRGGRTAISSFRRNAQRTYIDRLTDIMLGGEAPEDARSLARFELARIAALAKRARPTDKSTRAHLDESRARIRRALDASVTLPKTAPPPNPFGG